MSATVSKIKLTIANGGSTSATIAESLGSTSKGAAKAALSGRRITLFPPATLTGTVTVEVTPDGGTTWYTLQKVDNSGAFAVTAATQALLPDFLAADDLRLKSSGTEAAQRDFILFIQQG